MIRTEQPVPATTKSLVSRFFRGHLGAYVVAIVFFAVSAFPLWLMLVASFSNAMEIFSLHPSVLPTHLTLANFVSLFRATPFLYSLRDSLVYSGVATVGGIIFTISAGYAFAKIPFRGREALFWIMLGSMMIPAQMTLVPAFIVIRDLGLINNLLGLILPNLAPAFCAFLARQFIAGAVSDEIIDAARMDGATEVQVLRSIVFPLVRPIAIVIGILIFIGTWNDFLWPLVIMSTQKMFTVPVALSVLVGAPSVGGGTQLFGAEFAGALIASIPVMVVFLALQRYLAGGIAIGGVKG